MNRPVLANFLLFQSGWFAIVLSAAALQPWFGVAVAVAIIGWHLRCAADARAELQLVLCALLIGTAWDSLLVTQGWLSYPAGQPLPWLAPYWIIALWGLFAVTLNVSLRWLRGRLVVASLAGAVGGPLAFYAGERLGAVSLVEMPATLLILALGWGLLTPALLLLARRFDGYRSMPMMETA